MKIKHLLPGLLCLFAIACSEDKKIDEEPSSSLETRIVTLDAGGTNDAEVLVFKQDDNGFMHLSTINSGWVDGKTTVKLEKGDYKFLFHKSEKLNCDMFPSEMTKDVAFEHIKWDGRKDDINGEGYMLPVDEIWLPETHSMANNPYSIKGNTTVSNRLTRAVSQVMVHLRKGNSDNTETRATPVATKAVSLGTLDLSVNGVGNSLNVIGGTGNSNTRVAVAEALTDEEEIISFTGPFVFPSDSGEDANVTISYTPNENSDIPAFTTTVSGPLERNRKLEITVWLGDGEPIVEEELKITYEIVEMEDSTDSGDSGIWE